MGFRVTQGSAGTSHSHRTAAEDMSGLEATDSLEHRCSKRDVQTGSQAGRHHQQLLHLQGRTENSASPRLPAHLATPAHQIPAQQVAGDSLTFSCKLLVHSHPSSPCPLGTSGALRTRALLPLHAPPAPGTQHSGRTRTRLSSPAGQAGSSAKSWAAYPALSLRTCRPVT